MSETTHIRTCPLCEAMCGLQITVEGDRVTKIRPDDDDVWSKGYICPKGTTLGYMYEDPDRLRHPVVKRDGEFVEVSWEEAFRVAHEKIRAVIDGAGMDALAIYFGNPIAHNIALGKYIAPLVAMSGITVGYSAGTVDQWPKNLSSALMFGGMWTIPVPDIDRSDFVIVMGANPHASQGSLLAAPDVCGRLREVGRRGGKVVVIDPRRTGTVNYADEWLPIRPGTDAALLMAMVNVLFAEGLVDLGHLEERVNGVDEVEALCKPFTPEFVAATCRISADRIRELARELAAAERAAVYGRIGTCNQEFGTLASWLVDVLNVLTGNLDREGGAMFANPIAWSITTLPNPDYVDGYEFGRWKSRVRGAPEVFGQFPVSCMAEEIATPGEGQLKGLITIAGNPAISAPDAGKLHEALPMLDCLVSVDNWINETSSNAHVILPGMAALEIAHYDDLIWKWAVGSAGNYSPAIFPNDDRPQEWEVLLALAGFAMGQSPDDLDVKALDDLFFHGLVDALVQMPGFALEGQDAQAIIAQCREEGGPERILDFQIRTGPFGDHFGAKPDGLTLADFEAAPHGIDKGPLVPVLDEILETKSGKIELAPAYITADLERLKARIGRDEHDLVLVSRRHVRSNNSWMHNVPSLVTGRDRCTLLIHPDDASRCGVRDGAKAEVRSEAGAVIAPVEVSDEMMPGVVSLPHGWGHDRPGIRVAVAREHAGVNNNVLAPGEFVDEISGNQAVNGIPVTLAPV
jgi:anaerobic selenocysteine-containing dehydrogenase